MRTKTVTKLVDNLTPAEYAACRSLSMRGEGQLWYDLYHYRHGYYYSKPKIKFQRSDKPCYVIMIKSDDGTLLGWAMMSPEINQSADYLAQFYVRKSMRGRGYGSRLMKHCLKIDPQPWVIPFTSEAAGLFKKHKTSVRFDSRQKEYSELMK